MDSRRFHWVTTATALLATLGAVLILTITPVAAGIGLQAGPGVAFWAAAGLRP